MLYGNMENNQTITEAGIRHLLEEVMDPEIPVLSIIDLGILRSIELEDRNITITITPTYSGCPAMDVIKQLIRLKLLENGYNQVTLKQSLSPAWTTDWMTEAGKEKLTAYGIAPPLPRQQVCKMELFEPHEAIQCPHCHSWHTTRISEFGSTPCKALYRCEDCKEPFDYFKSH
jgi:ring-1,2-phenylacetyl-CoA epoxidase subunit PaaD